MVDTEVLGFIKHFQNPGTIATFTEGCCYWFARILCERFRNDSPIMMYDPVMNHFAALIRGHIYDVTGEIYEEGFVVWDEYEKLDELESGRIERYCIKKYD